MCGQFAVLGSLKAIKDYFEFLLDCDFILDEDEHWETEYIQSLQKVQRHREGNSGIIVKPMDTMPIVAMMSPSSPPPTPPHSGGGGNSHRLQPTAPRLKPLTARWGLVPFWAKDEQIAYKTINARIETLLEKPSFKYAYQSRRCLVPMVGFYERGKDKKLHYFPNKNDELKSFAGLYEIWGANKLTTFTIVTCPADETMRGIHHRMPMVLDYQQAIRWLTG